MKAFVTLSHFRDVNGSLQFADLIAYAKVIGEEDVLRFVEIMVEANRAYIAVNQEDRKLVGKV